MIPGRDLYELKPELEDDGVTRELRLTEIIYRGLVDAGYDEGDEGDEDDPGQYPNVGRTLEAIEKVFAARIEKAAENLAKLPPVCFGWLEPQGELIRIKRGVSGYFRLRGLDPAEPRNREEIDDANKRMGVTRQQREAMESGSMFGWHLPAADPDQYDSNGRFAKVKVVKGPA